MREVRSAILTNSLWPTAFDNDGDDDDDDDDDDDEDDEDVVVVVKMMMTTIMVTAVVMVLMMIRTVSCGARWYLLHHCVLHQEWIARLI